MSGMNTTGNSSTPPHCQRRLGSLADTARTRGPAVQRRLRFSRRSSVSAGFSCHQLNYSC
ncbi:hypothetical protein AOLI_G00246490 [Acnodon oligacanthus]